MWLTYALTAAILWGLNYALTERLVESISPITLLAFEMLAGAILFTTLSYFTTLKKDVMTLSTTPYLLKITFIEVITVLLASYFIVSAIKAKNATIAGIIELIYPLFTLIFTWLLFRNNHANYTVLMGGGLIFIGVLLMTAA